MPRDLSDQENNSLRTGSTVTAITNAKPHLMKISPAGRNDRQVYGVLETFYDDNDLSYFCSNHELVGHYRMTGNRYKRSPRFILDVGSSKINLGLLILDYFNVPRIVC
ncbi:hypothetical protein THIOM_005499 [Candidatus Thiomargarita nelsonii]|uniref:Uncharacterized protein n=1 Tax=Candidatus Thiomargarita nelsonii TaxID=1003181 RepID=A0A176RT12_9GAMM|nr:hypothetical protein THIOM_005499 [Candidatus Thiomargarita nelsonii]